MMRCETCQGSGKTMRDSLPAAGVMPGDPEHPPGACRSIWEPCRACNGSGQQPCFDGAVGVPDEPTNGSTTDAGR